MKTIVLSLALLAMPAIASSATNTECNDLDFYTFKKRMKVAGLYNESQRSSITPQQSKEVLEHLSKCQSFLGNQARWEPCQERLFLELYIP